MSQGAGSAAYRDLNRRVEVAVPIADPVLKRRVTTESLDLALTDNTNAWLLDGEGSYRRVQPGSDPAFHLQTALMERLVD